MDWKSRLAPGSSMMTSRCVPHKSCARPSWQITDQTSTPKNRPVGHFLLVNPDRAGDRSQISDEQLCQSGFAATRTTDPANNRSRRNIDIDTMEQYFLVSRERKFKTVYSDSDSSA